MTDLPKTIYVGEDTLEISYKNSFQTNTNIRYVLGELYDETISVWRLMETAPKDGTTILVMMPSGNCYHAYYKKTEEWQSWYTPTVGNLGEPLYWIPSPLKPKDLNK